MTPAPLTPAPLVALDARLTRQMSVGMKAYVREVVQRLPRVAPDLRFAVFSNDSELVTPGASNADFWPVSEFVADNGGIGEQFAFPRRLAATRPDLTHHMSVYAPRWYAGPRVYTIHDLIHLRFPQYFSWKVPPYYRFVVGPVARSARAVITDAHGGAADLERYLGVAGQRIRVIALGVAERFSLDDQQRAQQAQLALSRYGLPRPYFLYAGNHRPHKDLATLFAAWCDIGAPCDLVITEDGELGFDARRAKGPDGKLRLPGHVDVEDLIALYAGCVAAIQPSSYEGFGLSVLEAMACGAPAVVARTPALVEVGADAVLSFAPGDAAALSAIMRRLLSDHDERARLTAAGKRRASAFSWDATARATAAVYREALG